MIDFRAACYAGVATGQPSVQLAEPAVSSQAQVYSTSIAPELGVASPASRDPSISRVQAFSLEAATELERRRNRQQREYNDGAKPPPPELQLTRASSTRVSSEVTPQRRLWLRSLLRSLVCARQQQQRSSQLSEQTRKAAKDTKVKEREGQQQTAATYSVPDLLAPPPAFREASVPVSMHVMGASTNTSVQSSMQPSMQTSGPESSV